MHVKITRQHMPQELHGLISGQADTWLTLCQVHEAEFRKLGWLVGTPKEEEN